MATRDDLINAGRGLMDLAGGYYLGKRGEESARAVGEAAMAAGEQVGMTGAEMAQFKPYTVTSALATGATTPEGGLDLQLSPEELARQQRRFEQAEGLFGRIGGDPARAVEATPRARGEKERTSLAVVRAGSMCHFGIPFRHQSSAVVAFRAWSALARVVICCPRCPSGREPRAHRLERGWLELPSCC